MVLEFRRQPLKAGYLTYKFLSTLFVRIPYWLFRYAFKGSRPRPSWSVKRCIEVKILRDTVVFGDITTKYDIAGNLVPAILTLA